MDQHTSTALAYKNGYERRVTAMADSNYTIKDAQTGEILFRGSSYKCAAWLGTDTKNLRRLAMLVRKTDRKTRYSKYIVECNTNRGKGGAHRKDIVCCDCGVMIPNAASKRKRCPECAYRYNLAQKRNRMRRVRAKPKETHPPISNPNRNYCEGCFYWRGESSNNQCCNYIFIEDKRRPCPPGEGCTVRKECKHE